MTPARTPRLLRTLVSGGLSFLVLLALPAGAQTTPPTQHAVTVSAVVEGPTPPVVNPSVEFHGLASPGATVSLVRGGTEIGSATASASATFDFAFANQTAGTQTYSLSATDTNGRTHPAVSFALNLVNGTNTTVNGIFLGPSIAVPVATVELGGTVSVVGSTAPGSAVTVTVDTTGPAVVVTADATGQWAATFTGTVLGAGSHTAVARAVSTGALTSEPSAGAGFTVNPSDTTPPDRCDGKLASDLNCDGRVNLLDFSILLYFWLTRDPSNDRVDLNHNGVVDVIDFSILLYQWSG